GTGRVLQRLDRPAEVLERGRRRGDGDEEPRSGGAQPATCEPGALTAAVSSAVLICADGTPASRALIRSCSRGGTTRASNRTRRPRESQPAAASPATRTTMPPELSAHGAPKLSAIQPISGV